MMISDAELLAFNAQGLIPGPFETEDLFLERIEKTKKALAKDASIDWEKARLILEPLYAFTPGNVSAFYSRWGLTPWQGAAAWIDENGVPSIQLRKSRLYCEQEILAHEAVHAARAAFQESFFEEFFAYRTSEKKWRQILGPIIRRPWEAWPFILFSFLGLWTFLAYWGLGLWTALGFFRLIRGHLALKKAMQNLEKENLSQKTARAILVRLTDEEIWALAKGKRLESLFDSTLRWRLLHCLKTFDGPSNVFSVF